MKRFCLVLLFFAGSVCATAQRTQWVTGFVPVEGLGCLDSSRLYFPSGDQAFRLFFQRLDTLLREGTGQINILHIGGSHVQAGTFSHQVRMHWQQLAPGMLSCRGLVFPYTVAKTNNPYNYQVKCCGTWSWCKNTQKNASYTLGLSGMVVCATTPDCSLQIRLRNSDMYADFRRVRLLGHSDSNRVLPVLKVGERLYTGEYDAQSYSFLFELEAYTDSLELLFYRVDSLWEPFYIRGFLLDSDAPGVTYHAVGVNGASVPSYLQCPLLENDLRFVKPDLCIFGIGINDANTDSFDSAEFRRRYEVLIGEILHVSPQCRFLFVTNNDSYRSLGRRRSSQNPNGPVVEQTMYRIAAAHEGAVWDLFAVMGGLGAVRKWEAKGLVQRDKVHFTVAGYKYIGDLLFSAMMDAYADYVRKEA